jgi:hypothetical protein
MVFQQPASGPTVARINALETVGAPIWVSG